jgi:VWFA-related protein
MTYDGWNAMRFSFSLALACCAAFGQVSPQEQTVSTVKDEPATFKSRVNLVMVPVVVRDKQGRAVGTLKQDDFQLADRGKPQTISRFTLERAGGPPAGAKGAKVPVNPDAAAAAMPERYVAYLFDDIHTTFPDLIRSRDAAWTHVQNGLRAVDRAAVFTTSGRNSIDFTDDKDAIHAALMKLYPAPISLVSSHDCPEVGYYLGDLIHERNDPIALAETIAATMACAHLDSTQRSVAESMTRAAAARSVAMGGQEAHVTLTVIRDVIRRMAATPGQRVIILASAGFIAPGMEQEKADVMDRAIRANITLNTLDARGLFTDPSFDAGRATAPLRYVRDEAMANEDVLLELAHGTGGKFFHNNNDLAGGFKELSDIPEYLYILGFSPQNLKFDGSYHTLKVSLRVPAGLTATARRGYYAPRHLSDPVETAKEETREALFSREEMREIPVEVQSQFFKPSNDTAKVTVAARIDLKGLKFRKAEERNCNKLTVTFALFDRNGNYVAGQQKVVDMKLKDETLARPTMAIVVRSSLDIKPGVYLIRVVVRDDEGQSMSALNGAADIP